MIYVNYSFLNICNNCIFRKCAKLHMWRTRVFLAKKQRKKDGCVMRGY